MVNERGLDVHHTTIYRWVQYYVPELEKRCRAYLSPTNDSWRVDETYIKIKGMGEGTGGGESLSDGLGIGPGGPSGTSTGPAMY